MRDWGYEQVGEITEVAGEASGLRRGGIVWGADVVPFSRASEAFEKLAHRPDEALQVVLQF